jgi:hypothetical protein
LVRIVQLVWVCLLGKILKINQGLRVNETY